MEAIVCAGALAAPRLQQAGISRVPLMQIGTETVLHRICRCLIEGGACHRIHVLAPPEVPLPDLPEVAYGPYNDSLMQSMLDCIETSCSGTQVLVSAGDIPLVTPEAIRAVCTAGLDAQADVLYPIAPRQQIEHTYPGARRTYLRLREGQFTGGNVFWLNRKWIITQRELLEELFARRKSPLALARLFGWSTLFSVLFGWASIGSLERTLSRILSARVCACVLPYPELAMDLDKLKDLIAMADQLGIDPAEYQS